MSSDNSMPMQSDDYRYLLTNDIPLMDTRAPVEFAQGAFPQSVNLPLMTDEERAAVGTCYKRQGQDAAIQLGHKLVCGEVKAERVERWKAFCQANPDGFLYCFRGGMRSQITQQWLKEAGVDYPFVTGGYKAMRRYLLETIDQVAAMPMTIIGGNTGCGKTDLIKELGNGIDLEGAAHHRGSSFGRFVTQQSTQINFDNQLATQMLKRQDAGYRHFVYEDESKAIGSVSLPLSIHAAMQQAGVVVVDDPFDVRLERLLQEYVVRMQADYVQHYGEEQGWLEFAQYLERGMFNIRKRLGYERHGELLAAQQQAIRNMQATGDLSGHADWLVPLLEQYYDPMYQYQLSKKAERIVFTGDYQQVKAWLETNTAD